MNFSEVSKKFNDRIREIYSADYKSLRAALTAEARRLNQKVSRIVDNVRAETIRKYFAKQAEETFKAAASRLTRSKGITAAQLARVIELRTNLINAEPERIQAQITIDRRILDTPADNLLRVINWTFVYERAVARAPEVFARHVSPLDLNGNLITVDVNVYAIYQECFGPHFDEWANDENDRHPDSVSPLVLAEFGDTVFKEWIYENRLNRIAIPPNRNLFMMRTDTRPYRGINSVIAWTAWRQSDGSLLGAAGASTPFWLGKIVYAEEWFAFYFRYKLEMYLVEPKREGEKFVRVGYTMYNRPGDKNCLVRILSPFVQNDTRERFDELTKDLIHKEDAPAFITPEFIDRLGKLMRVKISLYTPYGAMKDQPAQILGAGGNKKNFKIIVKNEHANVYAPAIVNKVNYINSIDDYIAAASKPNMSTVVDIRQPVQLGYLKNTPWQFYDQCKDVEAITGYITVDGFGTEAITTMNKFLRPSAITGNPNDDTNPALFTKTTPAGIFMYDFVRKNKLTIPPEFVARQASVAGRPFGTAELAKCKKGTHVIEIDQNASYASYEFSPFYEGFPVGNWIKIAGAPTEQPDPELKPAFVEVAAMRARAPQADIYNYGEMLGQLRSDFSVITYPEYKRWLEYFDIDVINTTYATFQRISVYDDLNALTERIKVNTPEPADHETYVIPAYVKNMRNSFTGKLIQGGLEIYGAQKTISTTSRDEWEIMIAEHQKEFGTLPDCEIKDVFGDGSSKIYRLTTTINKPGHKFPHIYAYITAISRLSVLEKLIQLKTAGFKPVRVHVDAIYVRCTNRKVGNDFARHVASKIPGVEFSPVHTPGLFKAEVTYKQFDQPEPTKSAFNINDGEFYGIMSHAQPAAEGYPGHRKVVVIGAGGIGKSTVAVNFLRDRSAGRALYLTPTRELRSEMRDKLDAVGKEPSDCICLEGLRRAITHVAEATERGKMPAPEYIARLEEVKAKYTYLIIDEFCKTDGVHLREVIRFAETYRKNIVMMGDYNQTVFSLSGIRADKEKLTEWGFMLFADPRNARAVDKPMRHSYEWGTFLDSIAELQPAEQVAALQARGIRVVAEDAQLDPTGLIYCGNWATIAKYNGELLTTNTAARVKLINKRETLPYAENLKPQIWNKASFTEKQPRGAKYSVDFAITVDCVQGSTVENPIQYIHVASLVSRWGAIYTAVTRSRTPEQIVLVM